jgi:hypothetical protein
MRLEGSQANQKRKTIDNYKEVWTYIHIYCLLILGLLASYGESRE